MLIWTTELVASLDFASAWDSVLRASAHAHFALERAWLEWEAAHGRHALAVVDTSAAGPLIVAARRERGGLVSGWPWRWQVARSGGADATPEGLSAGDAVRALQVLAGAGQNTRVRMHLPLAPGNSGRAPRAGTTTLLPLGGAEKTKQASGNKRREARKAGEAGWVVEVATTRDEFRRFAELQRAAESRRGRAHAVALPEDPSPGESWREWEHPWMWLLVAKRDGVIGAGSGFGRSPGGMVDYRANASSPEGREAGANALLAVEAVRLATESGHRFINWGGATTFKRSLGGSTLPTWEWLGGGAAWAVPNTIESLLKRARSEAAAGVKALSRRGAGKRKG